MDNAWLILLVALGALLLATPAVRRWWNSDERRGLVDPKQDITVEPVNQGTQWFSDRMSYRPRRQARGRRHQPPQVPSANRVRREPPSAGS
jgi:hypothetical protein